MLWGTAEGFLDVLYTRREFALGRALDSVIKKLLSEPSRRCDQRWTHFSGTTLKVFLFFVYYVLHFVVFDSKLLAICTVYSAGIYWH